MGRYFVINAAGGFFSHCSGCVRSWGPLSKANEFQTIQSARYVADEHLGARVVELKGRRTVEVH